MACSNSTAGWTVVVIVAIAAVSENEKRIYIEKGKERIRLKYTHKESESRCLPESAAGRVPGQPLSQREMKHQTAMGCSLKTDAGDSRLAETS